MRTRPRRRHYVRTSVLRVARVAFRYSRTRDAYVLRGIGSHIGPVLKRR
ncbi:MAG TPA: hypothetical protein VF752_15825 [Thermoleophilaceae bacterium]